MPTQIIQFPSLGGGMAAALVKTGRAPRKSVVRFPTRPPRKLPPAPFDTTRADQDLVDGARLTAANYRKLAEKASTARQRAAIEEIAARWERHAEELLAAKHGPQQSSPGQLFDGPNQP